MQLSLPVFDIDNETVEYNTIHRTKSTFMSGTSKAVHNWFRLTPSFGPDLVRIVLDEFSCANGSVVLDPFSGASTTLIEAQLMNIQCYGFEINPFLHFVGTTTLNWQLDVNAIQLYSKSIQNIFKEYQKKFSSNTCEQLPYLIPPIHNVYRWWRTDVLKDLILLKNAIIEVTTTAEPAYRKFFFLALAGILVPDLTNVTLGKLQLHFIDRATDEINVEKSYFSHLSKMITDYDALNSQHYTKPAKLFLTDSTVLDGISIPHEIDFVMTSPPYPNRYSYVWNTRPFLYFFDFFNTPKEASDLDIRTIGGTWGTATYMLDKGIIEPLNDAVAFHIKPTSDKIREKDNLMANYVMKYFNLLIKQIIAMDKYLSSCAKIAYVVGNSEIKGVFVETDILLSKVLKSLDYGYTTTKINRFRKRNSGQNLFESIVYGFKE